MTVTENVERVRSARHSAAGVRGKLVQHSLLRLKFPPLQNASGAET